jgi:hypothetical protein
VAGNYTHVQFTVNVHRYYSVGEGRVPQAEKVRGPETRMPVAKVMRISKKNIDSTSQVVQGVFGLVEILLLRLLLFDLFVHAVLSVIRHL